MVINEAVLKYEDSFRNLSNEANQHDVVIWDKPFQDQVFMDKLVKPHSWFWQRDNVDEDEPIKEKKPMELCEGSSFSDKITMLGIVEATFGG